MQHSIKIKWGGISKILSGNQSVETLIESNPLPDGFHWMVMVRDHTTEGAFMWNRKIRLRPSGKGQISIDGRSGFSCEMVRAKTSSGFGFDLVVVSGMRNLTKSGLISKTPREGILPAKGSLSLPFSIRRDSLEQDLIPYREMRGNPRSPIDWCRALGWGDTIKAAKFSGAFTAAIQFAAMVSSKRLEDKQWRFDQLITMGVTMGPDYFLE